MKIGILTMNRIINYGSFLQAYALQQMLRSLGADTEFLDIDPKPQRRYEKLYAENPDYKKNLAKACIHRLLGHREVFHTMYHEQKQWKFYHSLYNAFPQWWETWLGMDRQDNPNTCYDKIVVGSDEVFNCTQKSRWGTSMKWFGQGLQTDTLISYAASFGSTTWGALEDFGLTETVKQNLANFHALSVRDENSARILQRCGFDPACHLDPVLAYDYESITGVDPKLRDVLIVYTYPDRLREKPVIRQIQAFAKEGGLRLVSIGSYYDWCENPVLTPFEVLRYFRSASYVVTDTFHGSVFSLKFQKPFAVLIRDSNRQKLTDLLQRMGQQQAALQPEDSLEAVLTRQIPKEEIREKLAREGERTLTWLKQNLCL